MEPSLPPVPGGRSATNERFVSILNIYPEYLVELSTGRSVRPISEAALSFLWMLVSSIIFIFSIPLLSRKKPMRAPFPRLLFQAALLTFSIHYLFSGLDFLFVALRTPVPLSYTVEPVFRRFFYDASAVLLLPCAYSVLATLSPKSWLIVVNATTTIALGLLAVASTGLRLIFTVRDLWVARNTGTLQLGLELTSLMMPSLKMLVAAEIIGLALVLLYLGAGAVAWFTNVAEKRTWRKMLLLFTTVIVPGMLIPRLYYTIVHCHYTLYNIMSVGHRSVPDNVNFNMIAVILGGVGNTVACAGLLAICRINGITGLEDAESATEENLPGANAVEGLERTRK